MISVQIKAITFRKPKFPQSFFLSSSNPYSICGYLLVIPEVAVYGRVKYGSHILSIEWYQTMQQWGMNSGIENITGGHCNFM